MQEREHVNNFQKQMYPAHHHPAPIDQRFTNTKHDILLVPIILPAHVSQIRNQQGREYHVIKTIQKFTCTHQILQCILNRRWPIYPNLFTSSIHMADVEILAQMLIGTSHRPCLNYSTSHYK